MPTCNGSILHTDPSPNPPSHAPPTAPLPPWLSHSNPNPSVRLYSPSVTLSLSPSTITATQTIPWLQSERPESTMMPPHSLPNMPQHNSLAHTRQSSVSQDILQCYRELEESHRALEAHKKEAAWRLRRIELQLESEKACRKRQKMEEIEAQIKAIKDEEKAALKQIEMEYREQLASLTRESEAKEQKLSEQWASKHLRLSKCLQQQVNSCESLPEATVRRI